MITVHASRAGQAATYLKTVTSSFLLALSIVCSAASRAQAAPFAYVAGSGFDTVSVIDLETNTIVVTITLPTGSAPGHVAVAPDGMHVYVTGDSFPGAVFVVDASTNSVSGHIQVGNGPAGIAVGHDGRFVYVANQFDGSVSVISTQSHTVVATIPVGAEPTGIGVTPDNSRVYVADSVLGTVWVIDAGTNTVAGGPILVESNPQDLIVNPDGSKVYVSNFNSRSVSVIDTASDTVQGTISVGFFPLGLSSSPDGKRLYVVDNDPAAANGSLAVIDTATNSVLTRVALPMFHTARRVAIHPDGTRGYVTINTPQSVLMFDTATNLLVGEAIPINGIPEGIAITPAPSARQVPFSWIRAELKATSKPARVVLSGVFELGMRSDGIELESEPVKVSFSSGGRVLLDEVLPAGSFRRVGHQWAIFEAGSHGGGIRWMRVVETNVRGLYVFDAHLSAPHFLDSVPRSLAISLEIGDDGGSSTTRCGRRGLFVCR